MQDQAIIHSLKQIPHQCIVIIPAQHWSQWLLERYTVYCDCRCSSIFLASRYLQNLHSPFSIITLDIHKV